MVRAHSLLYAIYICLIVSIICGALLYFANLYGQLNVHYNLHEELYIQNQSVVNFALGNKTQPAEIPLDENSGIEGSYETKQYGLLTLLLAKSSVRNDTVASAHFVGHYSTDKTAIHLSNFSKGLSYSGTVKLIGINHLPTPFIETSYITNAANLLTAQGTIMVSEILLPEINPNFRKIFEGIQTEKTALSDVDKPKDSLYYNSFLNETKEINVNPILSNVIFKGNFVLRSKDSLHIRKNAVLEDVILIAPKITFEDGFKGTVQAFATQGIELGEKVTLNYPSVICVYNETRDISKIKIKKESKITGAVVLFGNPLETIDKNSIEIEESGLVFGTVYCTGKLLLKSNVYGSVYTNRFFHKTTSSSYDNTISNIEINALKRPAYFIAIPLFDTKKTEYGILKKVL
ncbi:hypothetical protein [Flavobacterium sp. GT3R68]|uniref:hypothetical protein n=1 Tax=Flavobacterium sp. GT3R68 TaxID=2594437 RepID=UPI000F898876|nr:hypothetical protein [Flavobacterium sp. GT3R68]RTY91787.1 hypothetical protein EKL32_18150 [Flavobacterium sp. GSN2]TRW90127.1 hypothetical protein FNW07_11760 [Flavobacterium sp. GT3R68]